MGMTKTADAIITEIFEAYAGQGSTWVALAKIAELTGLTAAEIGEAVKILHAEDETFRAEPEPFGFRITEEDRAVAVIIGGEARHKISWS